MLFISTGAFLTAVSFIIFNLLPSIPFAALLSVILVTFGEILAMPFMNTFWISRTVATNRGQYAGIYTMAWSLAQVAGPTGGTWIAGHFGFRILWWIMGALCLLTAFLFRAAKF